MSEWQPILTAPRDGTWFVIYSDLDDRYEIGRFEPLKVARYEEVGHGLFKRVYETVYDWEGFNNFHRATHWMPLPDPPQGA